MPAALERTVHLEDSAHPTGPAVWEKVVVDATSENPKPAGPFWPRWVLLGILITAVAVFFLTGQNEKLTWEYVQAQKTWLQEQVQQHCWLTLVVYFLVYVAVTALSVPGALPLTLVGGFLFNRWLGTVVVSFASTTGATLAFLFTRYLFRDWVQQRWGARLAPINRGVEREGAYYLFTLRLVPVVPFWLINLALGLTSMRVWTFWWVSQLGMLPATLVYVNAGAELGSISNPKDILSPTLLLALVLLGVLPLALRFLVPRLRLGTRVREVPRRAFESQGPEGS